MNSNKRSVKKGGFKMVQRSTLLSFDAFSKTEEDVRIRTRSGGLITLSCIVLTFLLLISEWRNFNEVVTRPQLVVDRDRQLKLDFVVDVTFPSMPCDLINLDIMDNAGELRMDIIDAGFTKTRIGSDGKEISAESFAPSESSADYVPEDEDYCGSCYGSKDQSKNDELPREEWVCCQTCEDVRKAYLEAEWAFHDGKNIDQCEREGYVERINQRLTEGCRLQGNALLNRISGTIHFAPGRGFHNTKGHFHDVSLYESNPSLNFNHIIHHLSFGKPLHAGAEDRGAAASTNPLDGRQVFPDRDTHFHQFSYFAKIVPTRYEYLDNEVIETAQFSTTFHDRPLKGGMDNDHPNTLHERGGSPGLFIYFEMSPLKVINKEEHAQTWSGFVLNCITSIGGVLAVGTMLDRVLYKAQRSIWGKKSQ